MVNVRRGSHTFQGPFIYICCAAVQRVFRRGLQWDI